MPDNLLIHLQTKWINGVSTYKKYDQYIIPNSKWAQGYSLTLLTFMYNLYNMPSKYIPLWSLLWGSDEVHRAICTSSIPDIYYWNVWTGLQHLTVDPLSHHFLLLTALDFSTFPSLSSWLLSVWLWLRDKAFKYVRFGCKLRLNGSWVTT